MINITAFRMDLRRFERALDTINKHCCFQNITLSQCHVMMEIGQSPGLNMNELGKLLNLDKSTVSRTVDSLVKSNWVERLIPENDRRTVQLKLTGHGKNLYKEINKVINSHLKEVFKNIEKKEMDCFLNVFHQISIKI